ncbi:DivIVA domain-containing protein [Bifidobacterium sp.]|uniref:DivIVA domain-containing protein n=1 Tax=Bifidobacterium sp. TaxID=41200 RepID=UPI0039E8F7CC
MARKPETNGNGTNIARVSKRKWGYDSEQVDEFLDNAHKLYESAEPRLTQRDIQDVSFGLRKNGYAVGQVDAALARLERAVVDKQTQWEISQNGRVAWRGQTESMYRKFIAHCEREENERFKPGTSSNPSYDRKQVDRLLDQLVQKLAQELGESSDRAQDSGDLVDLTPNRVSNVVFTQRKGKKGYDERQVDYFLNYGVQLMSRIESYARVTDYSKSEAPEAVQPQAQPVYDPQASAFESLAALAEPANPNAEETQIFQPIAEPIAESVAEPAAPSSSQMNSRSPFARPQTNDAETNEVGQSTETIRPLFDENGASVQAPSSRIANRARYADGLANASDTADSYANEAYSGNDSSAAASHANNDGRADFRNLHREEQAVFNQAGSEAGDQTSHTVSLPAQSQKPSDSDSALSDRSQSRTEYVPQQANEGIVNYPHARHSATGHANAETTVETPQEPSTAPSTFDFWGRGKASDRNSTMTQNMSFGDNGNVQAGSGKNDDDRSSGIEGQGAATGLDRGTIQTNSPLASTTSGSSTSSENQETQAFAPRSASVPASRSDASDARSDSVDRNAQTSFSDNLDSIQDTDQYLASLNSMLDSTSFPKVDLDIPDLAFPTTDSSDSTASKESQSGAGDASTGSSQGASGKDISSDND